jgi:biopolymer transport protein ExbD
MARVRRIGRTKTRFRASDKLDLTPLINCMFLLLVFFMVATTFINPQGISVDLPSGQADTSRATKDMNVVIGRDGTIQVNGELTEKGNLAEKIRQVIQADNTKNAILEADREVLHSEIIEVVDIARGEGIEGIAFAKAQER